MHLFDLLEQNPTLLLILTFVFSLLVGSFLNVVIYRFPKSLEYQWTKDCKEHLGEECTEKEPPSLVWARSHCQKCNHQIKSWENIPLLSFLFLRGKCSNCKTSISHRYWMVELLTALFSVLVVYKFGWSYYSVGGLLLTWFLVAIAMIDYDTMLIPDQLSLPLMWFGLFASLWGVFVEPSSAIKGALFGYLILWSIFHLFKLITGKDGMGYGDFKLLAAGGAWLGMKSVVVIIVMSSFTGAVLGSLILLLNRNRENKAIPFGPYLAMGIFITMLYGETIINWYMDFSGLS
jgi:leader peptidase (prepilin peptidase)/N-methyltransferase